MTVNPISDHCVDYLSYNFDLFDLHTSWKYSTRHKDSITNGRRLENASWRKFYQMKNKLQQIHPSELNWQKESDVVWLYGPFHTYDPLPILEAQYAATKTNFSKNSEKSIINKTTDINNNNNNTSTDNLKPVLKKRSDQDDFLQTLSLKGRKANNKFENETSNIDNSDSDLSPTTLMLSIQRVESKTKVYQKNNSLRSRDDASDSPSDRPFFYSNSKSLPQIYKHGKRLENTGCAPDTIQLTLENLDAKSPSTMKQIRFKKNVEKRLYVGEDDVSSLNEQSQKFSQPRKKSLGKKSISPSNSSSNLLELIVNSSNEGVGHSIEDFQDAMEYPDSTKEEFNEMSTKKNLSEILKISYKIDNPTGKGVKLNFLLDDSDDSDDEASTSEDENNSENEVNFQVLPKGVDKELWEKIIPMRNVTRSDSTKSLNALGNRHYSNSNSNLIALQKFEKNNNGIPRSASPSPMSPTLKYNIPDIPRHKFPPGITTPKQLDEYYANLYHDSDGNDSDENESYTRRFIDVGANAIELGGWLTKSAVRSVGGWFM
ncbi:hypothetical protein HDU92_004197 [Lobulomyces angularis]|nr:hypothetical protein HDU92_004197 [Lobulomyces angularis]